MNPVECCSFEIFFSSPSSSQMEHGHVEFLATKNPLKMMLFEANSELNKNRFPAFPLHFPSISGPNRNFSHRREWYHHPTDTIHQSYSPGGGTGSVGQQSGIDGRADAGDFPKWQRWTCSHKKNVGSSSWRSRTRWVVQCSGWFGTCFIFP